MDEALDGPSSPSFGNGADYVHQDGGAGLDGSSDGPADGSGPSVRVRLVHGLANVDTLVVCHDPDLTLDALDTPEDESANGPKAPVKLPLSAGFGDGFAYVSLTPLSQGALTFQRFIEPPPASDEDAGTPPSSDAGAVGDGDGDGDGDAGSNLDAGAGAADAGGGDADAGTPSEPLKGPQPLPLDPCDPSIREAVMPLPFVASWLDPTLSSSLELPGIATTLDEGASVTLFASGFAIAPQQIAARSLAATGEYLNAHPGDEEGAERAGREARALLEAAYGPRVLPAQKPGVREGKTSLSFAHLVPDVPSTGGPSGALKLCVKVDGVEQSALPAESAGFPFRWLTPVGASFAAEQALSFRAFVAEAFDSEGKGCASTNLVPIAELTLDAAKIVPGSYTLVALGTVAPDALCNAASEFALPRESCSSSTGALAPRLVLLED